MDFSTLLCAADKPATKLLSLTDISTQASPKVAIAIHHL